MLEAEHITVSYGAHRAIEGVSVHVGKGEICVILGANGAGKTTLLKAIAGLLPAQPGAHVAIDGHDISGERPNRIVEQGVALVPEGRGIFADLTVAENLELGAYGKQAREHRDERLQQVLRLFPKLGERRVQTARTMSGGEQQMVAIGRALMSNPKILMLDEPSLGLAPLLCSDLFKSLKQVRDTGVGILLVEQNARQSLAIADRAYLLENGHITAEGRAEALANDPAVQKAYLGGAGKDTHHRLGEPQYQIAAQAQLPARNAATAADLATRAGDIQRAHVEAVRHRPIAGHSGTNGRAAHLAIHQIKAGESTIVSSQAHELSRKAAEMANRAGNILAAHIIAERQLKTAGYADHAAGPSRGGKPEKPEKSKNDKKNKKNKKAKKTKKARKKTKKAGK